MKHLSCLSAQGLRHWCPIQARLRDACAGHVAIFSVLASQAACHGVESTVARTTSLDAWLERLVDVQMPPGATRNALLLPACFKSGNEKELSSAWGRRHAFASLSELSASLPLVSVSRTESGSPRSGFTISLMGFLWDRGESTVPSVADVARGQRWTSSHSRGDVLRAAVLLLDQASIDAQRFLARTRTDVSCCRTDAMRSSWGWLRPRLCTIYGTPARADAVGGAVL